MPVPPPPPPPGLAKKKLKGGLPARGRAARAPTARGGRSLPTAPRGLSRMPRGQPPPPNVASKAVHSGPGTITLQKVSRSTGPQSASSTVSPRGASPKTRAPRAPRAPPSLGKLKPPAPSGNKNNSAKVEQQTTSKADNLESVKKKNRTLRDQIKTIKERIRNEKIDMRKKSDWENAVAKAKDIEARISKFNILRKTAPDEQLSILAETLSGGQELLELKSKAEEIEKQVVNLEARVEKANNLVRGCTNALGKVRNTKSGEIEKRKNQVMAEFRRSVTHRNQTFDLLQSEHTKGLLPEGIAKVIFKQYKECEKHVENEDALSAELVETQKIFFQELSKAKGEASFSEFKLEVDDLDNDHRQKLDTLVQTDIELYEAIREADSVAREAMTTRLDVLADVYKKTSQGHADRMEEQRNGLSAFASLARDAATKTQRAEEAKHSVKQARRYEKKVLSEFEKLKAGVMIDQFVRMTAENRVKHKMNKKEATLKEHLKIITLNQNRISKDVENTWGVLLETEESQALDSEERQRQATANELKSLEASVTETISREYETAIVSLEIEMNKLAEEEKLLSSKSLQEESALRTILEKLAAVKQEESSEKLAAEKEEQVLFADAKRIRTSRMLIQRLWSQGGISLERTDSFLDSLRGVAKPSPKLLELYQNYITTLLNDASSDKTVPYLGNQNQHVSQAPIEDNIGNM